LIIERPNFNGLIDPGTIIDRRVSLTYADGTRTEWRLIVGEEGWAEWAPFRVSEEGVVIEELVWAPLPGSQVRFLLSPVFETILGGNRGGGKSLALLYDFAMDVGRGLGSAWRGVVFRRNYKDLDDFVNKAETWFARNYGPKFNFLRSKSEYMGVWDTGERLLFRHMESEDDYTAFHGQELPWQGWEELTQWPDNKAFLKMQSCCRSSSPGVIPRVRGTTNPGGVGHRWVKKRYELPQGYNKIITPPGEMPRLAIRSLLDENFVLLNNQPNYKQIIKQAAPSAAVASAWLDGSWDITEGGMFDDVWDSEIHVIPNIEIEQIPSSWIISRSYDHGQSHPFACQWWLESSGEPIKLSNGKLIGNIRGDLILWHEWYGCVGDDNPNTGIRLPSKRIAAGIIDREDGWGCGGQVMPGPADTEIFNKLSDRDNRSPSDDMEDAGVRWERADKSPGSRKRGYELIRSKLIGAKTAEDGTREEPGLFCCAGNRWWLEIVPQAPRSNDDMDEVDVKYPDHHIDATRYRISWQAPIMWRRGF
jgi:hypothetical protein